MTDVTNNHATALGMPDGTSIAPRETKSYANWSTNAKNGVVAAWVEKGLLSVGKSSKKDEPEVVEDVQLTEQEPEEAAEEVNELSEDEQKEALIAQLAELGVKADKRSSVEKLQEKLDEALAK